MMLDKYLSIKNKNDFVNFISALVKDLKENSEQWENKDLCSYLNGMVSWIEDMDGYYENTNQPLPNNVTWKVFSDILMAARTYE